jgi:hypothetical protein
MDIEDDSGPKSHQGVFAKKRKALTIKVQRGRGSGGGKKGLKKYWLLFFTQLTRKN